MPRITIDVNETWLNRMQQVIPAAIDTLQGLDQLCQNSEQEGIPPTEDAIGILQSQIRDLRRQLQTIAIIF